MFGGLFSYVWGLVFLCLRLSFLTFGDYSVLQLGVSFLTFRGYSVLRKGVSFLMFGG